VFALIVGYRRFRANIQVRPGVFGIPALTIGARFGDELARIFMELQVRSVR
jgi:hypothetical protein